MPSQALVPDPLHRSVIDTDPPALSVLNARLRTASRVAQVPSLRMTALGYSQKPNRNLTENSPFCTIIPP